MLGELTAAITLMGPVGAIDDDLESDTARLLREKARSISAMAGWEGSEPNTAPTAD
ncbi:hypothetical protein D3C78_1322680 [compost metagenome]